MREQQQRESGLAVLAAMELPAHYENAAYSSEADSQTHYDNGRTLYDNETDEEYLDGDTSEDMLDDDGEDASDEDAEVEDAELEDAEAEDAEAEDVADAPVHNDNVHVVVNQEAWTQPVPGPPLASPPEPRASTQKRQAHTKHKEVIIPEHLLHKTYMAPFKCTVRSPSIFVACVTALLFTHGMFTQYSYSAINNSANRYPFTQTECSFMNGLEYTGIIVGLILMSFFSNRFHRPVAMSVGSFICSVGSLLCAVPYFADGPMDNVSERDLSIFLKGETCEKYNLTYTYQGTCNLIANQKYEETDTTAFSLICVGQFIVGIGASLYITNVLVHIEESVDSALSVICIGVSLSMHGLGMFAGSIMATGFSTLPESVNGGQPLVSYLEKVGAWWLGFCVAAGMFFLTAFLFLIFPKWFVEPKWLLRRRERYYKKLIAKKRDNDRQKKIAAIKATRQHGGAVSNTKADKKDQGKNSQQVKQTMNGSHAKSPVGADIIRPGPQASASHAAVNPAFTADFEQAPNGRNYHNEDEIQCLPTDSSSDHRLHSSHKDAANGRKHNSQHLGKSSASPKDPAKTPEEIGTKTLKYIKKKRSVVKTKKYLMRREQFKDISRHIWRLLRNIPVALCFCGSVLASYTITGYCVTLTKYLKIKFHRSQVDAEYAAAFVGPLGFTVGTFLGGVLIGKIQRLRNNLHLSSCLILCTLPITVGCMIALMFFTCHIQDNTASLLSNPKNWTCQSSCDCTDTLQDPVCGDDGHVYPSACMAGCHYIDAKAAHLQYTFSTCGCIKTPTATASYGICKVYCPLFFVYIAVAFVAVTAFNMGQVPVLLIFFRAVRDRYRSLSIGFGVWLVYILGYIIGPVIFTEIRESRCEYEKELCKNEESCWHYDLESLAYLNHGIVILFLVAAMFMFAMMVVFLMPRRFVNPNSLDDPPASKSAPHVTTG